MNRHQRIMVYALAGLMPLLALVVLFLGKSASDTEAQIVRERVTLARAAALVVDVFVRDNVTTLAVLSLAPAARDDRDIARLTSFLAEVATSNPNWESVGLLDARGLNLTGTAAAPARTVSVADREYFRQTMATGKIFIGDAIIGRVTEKPAVVIAQPVQLASGDRGVLTVVLSLASLEEELRALPGASATDIVVVDRVGHAILHPDPRVVASVSDISSLSGVRPALGGETGSLRDRDERGDEVLSAYAPSRAAGWGIVVRQPAAAAFGLIRSEVAQAGALTAVGSLFALVVAWVAGRRVQRYYDEAHQRRAFLEALIASAPVAIAIHQGPQHVYTAVNDRFRGLKPGVPMLGRTAAEVFPETLATTFPLLDGVYRTGETVHLDEQLLDLVDRDGMHHERYFTMVFARFEDASGRPEGVITVAVEQTEAVRERRRAAREKDEFLVSVGHELKTPLSSASVASQLIARATERGTTADIPRYVALMRSQMQRVAVLIGQLLEISRFEQRIPMVRAPLDIVSLTRTVVDRQRTLLGDGAYELAFETEVETLPLLGDEPRIDQVITNLLSNAVKYSPDGGRVEVRLARDDGYAVVTVTDHGIGIPQDERESVFSPFARSREAKARGIEGSGLGLNISRRTAEAHGGSLEVSETPGGGTTMTVRLPLS